MCKYICGAGFAPLYILYYNDTGMGKSMFKEYEALAAAYDSLMYDISFDDWAGYIAGFLRGCPMEILECGCGTGNITKELVKRGYDTVAVDRSPEMLGVAESKLRGTAGHCELVCADMAGFRLNRQRDAVISACDCVNYILDAQGLDGFFGNTYANLRPGGIFLFDISSVYKLSEIIGDNFFYDDNDESTLLWQNSYDNAKKLAQMDITLFIRAGEVYKRYDESHIQRAWDTGEISDALGRAGFTDIENYGFGTKNAPDKNAQRIQFYAKKES
jgi:SAM-dependent methyltransferase